MYSVTYSVLLRIQYIVRASGGVIMYDGASVPNQPRTIQLYLKELSGKTPPNVFHNEYHSSQYDW